MYFVPFILILNLKLFHNIDATTRCQRDLVLNMATKQKDLRSYFEEARSASKSEIPNEIAPIIMSGSGTVMPAELSMVTDEIERAIRPRKNYNKNISDKMKVKIGEYAIMALKLLLNISTSLNSCVSR